MTYIDTRYLPFFLPGKPEKEDTRVRDARQIEDLFISMRRINRAVETSLDAAAKKKKKKKKKMRPHLVCLVVSSFSRSLAF